MYWLALTIVVHVAFATSLGLFVSVKMAATVRSMIVTLLFLAAAWTVPLVVSAYLLDVFPSAASESPWVKHLLLEGVTAPMTWRFLAEAISNPRSDFITGDRITGSLIGLGLYAVAAWVLWRLALLSFRRSANGTT